jgi:MYXO-CTERM domain-containing protein
LDPDGAAFEVDAHFVGGDLFRVTFLPYAAGPLRVAVCAEDRQANLACAEPVIIEVGATADGGPGGDDGGCACTAGTGDGGWLLALVVVASWFRRRSTRQVEPKPMSA